MATHIDAKPRAIYAEYGRTLVIRPGEGEDPAALFEQVCADFENTKIEQDSEGNVSITSPTGGESSNQNSELTMQLRLWTKQDGRGRAFDSNVLFILPNGSRLGPDAAWVSNAKLAAFTKVQLRKFLPIVPEFVVELKSPSDHFSDLQAKMRDWIRHGVALGWLIHPDIQTVGVYRSGSEEVSVLTQIDSLLGEGPVPGFQLDLKPIWEGLILVRINFMSVCTHIKEAHNLKPAAHVCEDCIKIHGSWVHLRLCLECGHVGCCDSSPNTHATKHFHATKHPVVRSIEPGEQWAWCYADSLLFDISHGTEKAHLIE